MMPLDVSPYLWVVLIKDHAGSKKFMSPLEGVLLAQKPVVSVPTYRLLMEILADLTYMYGGEKGCEGLLDLWKKVKSPQDSERVSHMF
jgi:hypothetical protein